MEDSYANTLLFTDADTLSYDEIIFAANSFLPREVCVPFYTLTFVASETTEGCPQNSELGLAISRLCSSSIAKKASTLHEEQEPEQLKQSMWECIRYPIMSRQISRGHETLIKRDDLEIVEIDGNSKKDCVAFEQICSAAFHYEYSEDTLFIHRDLSLS